VRFLLTGPFLALARWVMTLRTSIKLGHANLCNRRSSDWSTSKTVSWAGIFSAPPHTHVRTTAKTVIASATAIEMSIAMKSSQYPAGH